MKPKMQELKDLLKQKATEIRNYRSETKEYQRKHGGCCGGRQWTLYIMKQEYRHYHIAYSMLRGKDYKDIESNSNSSPSCSKIDRIKEQYTDEDVRTDAA